MKKYVSPTTNKEDSFGATELAKRLLSNPDYMPGMPVQLMTCNGGTGPNPIAKQLADILGGDTKVSGYDGKVVYQSPLSPFSADVYPLPWVDNKSFPSGVNKK